MDDLQRWVNETRAAAMRYDNIWDVAAVEWPNLPQNAKVVELGTYKGRWAFQMCQRYPSIQYIGFEPQEWAWQTATAVLDGYNAIIYNYGLMPSAGFMNMSNFGTDGCKFAFSGSKKEIEANEVTETLAGMGLSSPDLMMINIEGAEYDVIPPMLMVGIIPQRLVIQFHEGDYYGLLQLIGRYYPVKLFDYGKTLTAWGIA